ncbi:hypothetical protein NB524_17855 [Vibrio alginolyticus]|uniref:hypothetical protein n=1 Tax=Vibrio alginolyticus TaxID=663 RepID=UPI00215C5BE0|nr:hypothetical protein [Vibrio alginolyticus]MCR9572198.1 hypothetical protein [Vibrio alginolyticus]
MRFIYLQLILFCPALSVSALEIETLTVSTVIDINELYTESIESAQFQPSNLVLENASDGTRFKTSSSLLRIHTTIPMYVSGISYSLTLNKNVTFCEDDAGNPPVKQNNFTSISVDDDDMQVGTSKSFSDFNGDDGLYKVSEHTVEFRFKKFSEINTIYEPEKCNGEIEFSVGVDI